MEQVASMGKSGVSSGFTPEVSFKEKIGYSLGDMAGNFVYQSVLLLLGFYYTEIYGLNPTTVAAIFLTVRIIDAVTDPVMGALVDRTKTRWGKYRPYLLFLCVPYAIASVLVFTVPDFGPQAKVIYAYVTYSVLMILFTATNIPYGAMTGALTSNPEERASINATRFMFATGGGLIITSVVLPMTEVLGNSPADGYRYAMMIMAALSVVLFLICFATTEERVKPVESAQSSLWSDLSLIWKNDQFRWLSLATFAMVTSQTIKNTTQMFYITTYVENAAALTALFMSLWMVGGMIGAQLATKVLQRVCKKQAYIALLLVCALMSAISYIAGNNNIAVIMGIQFFVGFFNQMIAPIWFTFTADATDYGESKFHRRIDGLTVSFTLFSLKVGLSVGGAIAMAMLGSYGYISGGVEQSPEAIEGVLTVFSIIPAIGFILTALVVAQFKMNSKTIAETAKKLEVIRSQKAKI